MKWFVITVLALLVLFALQHILSRAWIGQKKKYSIALYRGHTPLEIHPDPTDKNPIMTKFDVSDVRASFVADPFIVKEQTHYYLFMEVKSKRNRDIGEIAVAGGSDIHNLKYDQIILRENFHLSFPAPYKIEGHYYIIPESGANRSVRLYRATNFPLQWQFEKKILSGKNFADPVLFYHQGYWWIFVSDEEAKSLLIYYSRHFDRNYRLHPKAPFFTGDKSRYRNGGKILTYDGRHYRFVQDCSRYYGEKVNIYEITILDPDCYEEKFVKTLLRPSGSGWNATQMHQVDYLHDDDIWYAVVDGGSNEKENYYLIEKFFRRIFR